MNSGDNGENNPREISLSIAPTTGGGFDIQIFEDSNVDQLRWRVARKLQTPRDRLTFLHRDKVLRSGSLKDHGISDGSRIILLPSVESGFSTGNQGTEQSVVQAIESLSDQQIDDFLSGRSPLTLALRVEDHMMFVQLQLEQTKEKRRSQKRSHRSLAGASSGESSNSMAKVTRPSTSGVISAPEVGASRNGSSSKKTESSSRGSERLRVTNSTVPSLNRLKRMVPGNQPCMVFPNHELDKEIQNFVEQQNAKHPFANQSRTSSEGGTSSSPTTSGLNRSSNSRLTDDSSGNSSHSSAKINPALLTPTQFLPPQFFGHVTPQNHPHYPHHVATSGTCVPNAARPHATSNNSKHKNASKISEKSAESSKTNKSLPGTSAKNPKNSKSAEEKAYIDSFMQHEPGIFSGTFSGSLHPSIQDGFGRPRRDPSTIIQILRDLLSATNQQQFIPEILKNGNGVIVGRQTRLGCARVKQSMCLKPSSSSKSQKPTRGVRSSRKTKAESSKNPKLSPEYIKWIHQVKKENDTTRSKMAQIQDALRQKKNRRKSRLNGEPTQSATKKEEVEVSASLESVTTSVAKLSCPGTLSGEDEQQITTYGFLSV